MDPKDNGKSTLKAFKGAGVAIGGSGAPMNAAQNRSNNNPVDGVPTNNARQMGNGYPAGIPLNEQDHDHYENYQFEASGDQPYQYPQQAANGAQPQSNLVAQTIPMGQQPVQAGIPIGQLPPRGAMGGGGMFGGMGLFGGYGNGSDLAGDGGVIDQQYESMSMCPKCCAIVYIVFSIFTLIAIPSNISTNYGCSWYIVFSIVQIAYSLGLIYALVTLFNAIRRKDLLSFEKCLKLFKGLMVLTCVQTALSTVAIAVCSNSSIGLIILTFILTLVLQLLIVYYFYYYARKLSEYLRIRGVHS